MPSQPEAYPARFSWKLWKPEPWQWLILVIVPTKGLMDARAQVVDVFAEAYLQIGEFQEAFDEHDNPALRDWAVEPYDQIPEYDPNEAVTSLLTLPERLVRWFLIGASLLLLLGASLSVEVLHALGVAGFGVIDAIEASIPLWLTASGIVLLWLFTIDSLAHQALGAKLRAGHGPVQTRRRADIVGYGVWNRSLRGRTGLFLVGFFYVLNALPELPGVGRLFDDPAGYITEIITTNFDVFCQSDGIVDAVRRVYRKVG